MARRSKTTYGKSFRKKTSGGKHRKGTLIKYKYVIAIGAVQIIGLNGNWIMGNVKCAL